MEETMLQSQALLLAQKNLLDYFQTHDVKYVTEDAVFRNMNTGETYKGRAEVGAMLHFFYQVLFDAKAELLNYAVTEEKAVVEGRVKGKHTGNYNGIAATGKEVDFPLCITYYLKEGLIREAHIYMAIDVLMQQLGVGASGQKNAYLVRDIFYLKFGQFKAAKTLLQEAMDNGLMPDRAQARVFSDFTGDAYRLIFEEGFANLTDYEAALTGGMKAEEWQAWYERFKPLVERSHREILKQVI